jgi:hypothetical protein
MMSSRRHGSVTRYGAGAQTNLLVNREAMLPSLVGACGMPPEVLATIPGYGPTWLRNASRPRWCRGRVKHARTEGVVALLYAECTMLRLACR